MNAKRKLTLLMSLFLIANISNAQDIDYNATIQNQIKIHQSNNLPSELKIQADLQAINRESVKEIREFFFDNQKNPKLIAELSKANGISLGDLSRATGYSRQLLSRFFTDAGVHDFKENPNEVRDLVYKNYIYTPIASISEEILMNSITCTAPSKTFNIAGLKVSNIIIANEELRKKVNRSLNINEVIEPNIFGIEALIAAYSEGEEWLNQMLEYLEGNVNYLVDYVNENIPELKVMIPEGTYLVWIDCQNLKISAKEFGKRLLKEEKLRLSYGGVYGNGGKDYVRINIACPRANLEEGFKRILNLIRKIEVNN